MVAADVCALEHIIYPSGRFFLIEFDSAPCISQSREGKLTSCPVDSVLPGFIAWWLMVPSLKPDLTEWLWASYLQPVSEFLHLQRIKGSSRLIRVLWGFYTGVDGGRPTVPTPPGVFEIPFNAFPLLKVSNFPVSLGPSYLWSLELPRWLSRQEFLVLGKQLLP